MQNSDYANRNSVVKFKVRGFTALLAALALGLGIQARAQDDYTWATDSGGNWSDGWAEAGYPAADSAQASVGAPDGDAVIVVDVDDALMNRLSVAGGEDGNWTIQSGVAGYALTFDSYSDGATTHHGALETTAGTLTIEAPIVGQMPNNHFLNFSGSGTTVVSGGYTGGNVNTYGDIWGPVVVNSTWNNWLRVRSGGFLRVTDADHINASARIEIRGGTWESTPTYTAMELPYGNAAGQMQVPAWGGGATFAAAGTDFTLAWSGVSTPQKINMPGGNVNFNLGGPTSTHTVRLLNDVETGLNLTTTPRGILSRAGIGDVPEAEYLGAITGSGDLGVGGSGTMVLSGTANNEGRLFIIGAGLLRLNNPDALGANFNLIFGNVGNYPSGAGVLENSLHIDRFTRSLGAGANEVRFGTRGGDHHAGFSAFAQDYLVAFDGIDSPETAVWDGDGSAAKPFLRSNSHLLFGSQWTDRTVRFYNPVTLTSTNNTGTQTRTIDVRAGTGKVAEAEMLGPISNGDGSNARLRKTGDGALVLSGALSYGGATTIEGGFLRINHEDGLPPASTDLTMRGNLAVLEGSSNYVAYGATPTAWGNANAETIQFSNPNNPFGDCAQRAGFSAHGSDFTVSLGNGMNLVWWDTTRSGDFLHNEQTLVFSSPYADKTVRWVNPIRLTQVSPGSRTVEVFDGAAEIDAEMQGALSERIVDGSPIAGSLVKTGAGTLELSAPNTYTGLTSVEEGRLVLSGSVSGDASVSEGAVLAGTGTVAGRVDLAGGLEASLGAAGSLTVEQALNLDFAGSALWLRGLPEEHTDYTLVTFDALEGNARFAAVYLEGEAVSDPVDDGAVNGTHRLQYEQNAIRLVYAPGGGTVLIVR